MDLQYNKTDSVVLPITNTRISASEYNQIAGSLMHIVNTSGLTPDVNDNGQLLAALQKLVGTAVVETYTNGTSWYRVWSDGWCEQGGVTGTESTTRGQTISISFLKQFADTNYTVIASDGTTSKDTYSNSVGIITLLNGTKTATGVSVASYGFSTSDAHGVINWVAKGYLEGY